MSMDLFGPGSANNSVTADPAASITYGALDTFFKNCSSPTTQDGTEIPADWLNLVTLLLRGVSRMNGMKLDGVTPVVADANVAGQLVAAIGQYAQRNRYNYAVDTGAVNAMVANFTPTAVELVDGMVCVVTPAHANTSTTVTLNRDSLGALPVYRADGSPLVSGDIAAAPYKAILIYSASKRGFLLQNPAGAAPLRGVSGFSVPGSSNFTAPVTGWYWVEVYGAGGGAGVYTGTNAQEGEGGGGGGYAGGWLYLAAGTTVPVTIGAGGTSSGNGSGTAGGTSSFGSYMTATGGGPGTAAGGAGAGGVGSGGQIGLAGQAGMSGNVQYYAYVGIGGSAAGPFGGKGGLGSDEYSPTWPGGGGFVSNTASGAAGVGSPGAAGGVIISY